MKLAENAYAIGPSFTDHAYEAWEARAYARDAALESFTQDWRADITTDYRCKVFAKIDNAIEAVLDSIFNNVEKTNRFKRLIFAMWYSPDHFEKCKELSELLDQEITAVIEDEFAKGTDRS